MHCRYIFAFVALDALDEDFGGGAGFGEFGGSGFGAGGLFLRVFFGTFLCIYRESGKILFEDFYKISVVVSGVLRERRSMG